MSCLCEVVLLIQSELILDLHHAQVQKEDHAAWQAFCAASVRVVPTEARAGAALAPNQEEEQGHVLYQHRLPQLGDRMQRLLSETGETWQHHSHGMLLPVCNRDALIGTLYLLHVSCFVSRSVSPVLHFMFALSLESVISNDFCYVTLLCHALTWLVLV